MMDQNDIKENKYIIQNFIGRGGFADIYQCIDDKGQQFAMKVFKKSKDNHVQNEIKIQTMLKSQYFVRYIEEIRKENLSIVLEYCSGGDLQKQMEIEKKQFTEPDVLQLMKFILNAYYELISNGIIHRDLKPANILIKDGQYKLGDFGISKVVQNYEQQIFEKITIGSYQYMSPQLYNGKYTSKCDIWSLGIIIYYCLYQEFPWGDIKEYKNINQYFKIEAKELKFKSKPKISEFMKQIIQKCLQYEENDRCSWQELMDHPKLCSFQTQNLYYEDKQLIDRIRNYLNENNIIGHELFDLLTHQINQPLKMHQFIDIFKQFNPYLSYNEIVQIFQQLDNNKQYRIEVHQLRSWFYQNKLIDDQNVDDCHQAGIIKL